MRIIDFIKNILPRQVKDNLRRRPFIKKMISITYERDFQKLICKTVKPGFICADVGANVGQLTLLIAKCAAPEGKVFAFEAHPENTDELRKRIMVSKYKGMIIAENLAISDGLEKEVFLYPGRGNASDEWNIVGYDVLGKRKDPKLKVPSTSLDLYFPEESRLDFVKIDIEGAEALALKGMRRLLRESRPVILVEFHNDEGWAGRKELFDANYDIFHASERLQIDPERKTQRVYHCIAMPN